MPQPAPRERSAIFPRSRPRLAMKAPGKLTREGNSAVRLWQRSLRDGLAQCIRKIVEMTNQPARKDHVLPSGRPAPSPHGSQFPSSRFWEFPMGQMQCAKRRHIREPGMRRERDGVRIVRLPTIRSKHLDTFIHTLLSTIHACFSNYDIVHYHCLGPSLFSIFPRLFGKKAVVTVQGLDWQRKKWGWLSNRFLKIGEWTSARFPNQTIVVSRVLQDRYQSRHAKHTLLVPNGTEIREPRGDTHLHRLGLSSDGYVLFLGRFSREKNCNLLIEAFNKIDTSFKLVLAGGSSHTGDYAANLRKHASDRVLFLDWLSGDALAEVLSNAAFFVLPSDLEGLSLALLDAMGAGVCV
ncbi:MAG: hypothetical protein DMG96_00530 [Acidobacteria bacterium]|nr:MAG: hypothetical protein DMG96_00530 [Acidobacteriota bacterium]